MVISVDNFETIMTCIGAVRMAEIKGEKVYLAEDVLADLEVPHGARKAYLDEFVDDKEKSMVYSTQMQRYVVVLTEVGMAQAWYI